MRPHRLHWLDPARSDEPFPPPEDALREPNGLLAIGGDLSPERLVNAYSAGVFPWYNPDEPILWWSPDPRTVFTPDTVHVSRSLRRAINREDYAVSLDLAFERVISACAAPRNGQRGTWLGPAMREAYQRLHRLGHAHSIEVWRARRLIGGLYGVALGRVFFGESMFSRETNGSKLALAHLARELAARQFVLLDGQVGSPHLYRMGAFDLPRTEFRQYLEAAKPGLRQPGRWARVTDGAHSTLHLPSVRSER